MLQNVGKLSPQIMTKTSDFLSVTTSRVLNIFSVSQKNSKGYTLAIKELLVCVRPWKSRIKSEILEGSQQAIRLSNTTLQLYFEQYLLYQTKN